MPARHAHGAFCSRVRSGAPLLAPRVTPWVPGLFGSGPLAGFGPASLVGCWDGVLLWSLLAAADFVHSTCRRLGPSTQPLRGSQH